MLVALNSACDPVTVDLRLQAPGGRLHDLLEEGADLELHDGKARVKLPALGFLLLELR